MEMSDRIRQRMAFLAEEITRHQDLYYRQAAPEISDRQYDALFDELLELETRYPDAALPHSPTKRVGSDLDNEFPEIPHPTPMLSLDKVYSAEDLEEWAEKIRRDAPGEISFVVEEKVDGSTIVLHYERGVLVRAVTRGDGFVGNDITENVRTIRDLPLRIPEGISSVFRGEIYIEKEDFKKLNEETGNLYANPRNFAAGNLRRKKSSEVARIPLRAWVYEGLASEPGKNEHIVVLGRLVELGFRVSNTIGFFSPSARSSAYDSLFSARPWFRGEPSDLRSFITEQARGRDRLPYEIDGYVVKVNEYGERERLGHTAHHPRWAVAFKFEAPQAVSVVKDIEVQVGRTGRVTPVARIEPVWISGSRVKNVTLHNQDYILSLDVARGDRVAVSKRGDVIPAVEDVLEKNAEGNPVFRIPDRCPACGEELVRDGAHHFCPNLQCPARVYGRITFFVARGQMDIENLGSETIRTLLELGLVKDVPDLYAFDPKQLLGREGFGEKKVTLIGEGIQKSKRRPYAVVLASLGLDEIGPRVVELLIEGGYGSIDRLVEDAKKRDPALFTRIQGIGPKTAQRIIVQLNDPGILEMIERLRKAGLNFTAEGSKGEEYPRTFEGQVWCVTGSFQHFKPRELAMEEVKRRGGRVVSTVTKSTTHLLAGENPGSKLEKALKIKIRIVDEEEFLKLIG
jgi:DNA ligase (NAD+)